MTPEAWSCPVCEGHRSSPMFRAPTATAKPEGDNFRPSTEMFGVTSGTVVRCADCGHGSMAVDVSEEVIMTAYEEAADAVSLREEAGQEETARRALVRIERFLAPATVVDLGCWTGSFLAVAGQRGWRPVGIEPSQWAARRARERGIEVHERNLFEHGLEDASARLVVMCDVIEHLVEPGEALDVARGLLEPGGGVYITVPNAGSPLARAMGRRWWSVLPMHLQYFTPTTLTELLGRHGFEVVDVRSHAKAFSARYYAERLGGYSATLGRVVVGLVEKTGTADRMVAPDFGDRLAVLAIRR